MTENIVTGKKYRILTDAAQDTWDRISLWTKASDVYYNDNSTAEANRPINILKRSTAYAVGTVAYETTAPSWVMLRCTTAGTTAASTPSTYQTISSVGTTITDGTAKFTVYDVRPTTTLSSSAYMTPAVSLVNNLNSELTANGNKFYFDYQGGKYGFNTSSSRASGTFVPFGGTDIAIYAFDGTARTTDGQRTCSFCSYNLTNGSINSGYCETPTKRLSINNDGNLYGYIDTTGANNWGFLSLAASRKIECSMFSHSFAMGTNIYFTHQVINAGSMIINNYSHIATLVIHKYL